MEEKHEEVRGGKRREATEGGRGYCVAWGSILSPNTNTHFLSWWSADFGAPRNGSPEIHDMLAEYVYSESLELDMAKVSFHFVRGNHPKKFASTLVNFMGKCYPGEDDLFIARAVLMLERDALPLFRILRQNYKSSIDREPALNELLDEIAEKFYGVRHRSPLQGMFGDFFKVINNLFSQNAAT
ncbi:hypothetical protein HHK36_018799 [Tetracentron sinense]|uniref:Uncharacterized protein n=1 Tax=Tetracentron sinense TaxID=13715 RepID=A0A835DBM5_TETSI|nr:hypothetical protein HHK36_018799 [Tetracentron sinense]